MMRHLLTLDISDIYKDQNMSDLEKFNAVKSKIDKLKFTNRLESYKADLDNIVEIYLNSIEDEDFFLDFLESLFNWGDKEVPQRRLPEEIYTPKLCWIKAV